MSLRLWKEEEEDDDDDDDEDVLAGRGVDLVEFENLLLLT
jgi:hypothetical protein